MNKVELKEVLKLHKMWLDGEEGGVRADLSNANLWDADLSGVDLRYANLFGANLRNADLSNADLRYADLNYAVLRNANLNHADLNYAVLRYADLNYANLIDANLSNADLRYAYLVGADLSNANLSNAYLRCVRLGGANLSGADLFGADLKYSNLINCNLEDCNLRNCDMEFANLCNVNLDENERIRLGTILKEPITAWKKCRFETLVKLEVPKGAIVFSINGSKCRTNKAKVIEIIYAKEARSKHDDSFIYHVGDEIEIENFNLQYNVECGSGIHFFHTREEAENYI